MHPNLFLFIDRPTLLLSRDVFALPWTNSNEKQVKLSPQWPGWVSDTTESL